MLLSPEELTLGKMRYIMSKLWLLAAVSLVACSGGETTPEPKEPSAEQTPPKQMKKLNLSELIEAAEEVALVPSPAEILYT